MSGREKKAIGSINLIPSAVVYISYLTFVHSLLAHLSRKRALV
jgi:hypothetical protein